MVASTADQQCRMPVKAAYTSKQPERLPGFIHDIVGRIHTHQQKVRRQVGSRIQSIRACLLNGEVGGHASEAGVDQL